MPKESLKSTKQVEGNSEVRLSTGSLLLDLVVGGGQGLGFPAGKIINIVGDKSSGKTFIAAELISACLFKYQGRVAYNYDDCESGFTFDTLSLFGVDLMKADNLTSTTVEEFDHNVQKFLNNLKKEEIGIYVLDSLDGLSNEEIEERAVKRYKAMEEDKDFKEGSYGMKTPKFLSQEFFRTKTRELDESGTTLIIISQVRENIDPMSFKKWARSGGKALDFYAHTVLWLASARTIKKGDRTTGVIIKAKTDKSKTPRPFRECMFPLYFDYGIDNIGSCIDFLFDLRTETGELKTKPAENIDWEKTKKEPNLLNLKEFLENEKILEECRLARKEKENKSELSIVWIQDWIENNPSLSSEVRSEQIKYQGIKERYSLLFGLAQTLSRDDLIKKIEEDHKMYREMERRVVEKWEGIEESIKTDRRRKYL